MELARFGAHSYELGVIPQYLLKVKLDCTTPESTYSSLEAIYGTTTSELKSFILANNINQVFESSSQEKYGYEHYFEEFEKNFNLQNCEITPYWFHNTRVLKLSTFKEGILPLEDAIEPVEKLVDLIAKQLGIQVNLIKPFTDPELQHKMNTVTDSGPWGFLVKEFGIQAPSGIHDYLDLPELVQHIISYKYKANTNQLLDKFRSATKRCIVKFISHVELHPANLSYVINYLYHIEHNLKLDMFCSTNYSNCGHPVDFKDIVEITYYN